MKAGKRSEHNQVFKLVVEDGSFIGTMGIHSINWKNRTATTGAMMFDSSFWGKTYVEEKPRWFSWTMRLIGLILN